MRNAHDVASIRAAEAQLMATLPPGTLMERAATGLVSVVIDAAGGAYGLRVVLLVGSGDNGGDALLAGWHLATRGARVDAVLMSPTRHDHVETLLLVGGRIHEADSLGELTQHSWWVSAEVVIDGIVGIGGAGGLREQAARIVSQIPEEAMIISVDIPSGVDADTGEVTGSAVDSDVTVCMGSFKPGLMVDPGANMAGKIELIDIGLQRYLPEPVIEALQVDDVVQKLPYPERDSDKYQRGVVGIVAGSAQYPGAAVLSVAGAIRAGAGYVRLIAPSSVISLVQEDFPEVVATELPEVEFPDFAQQIVGLAGRVQSWVVGPGLGTSELSASLVDVVLDSEVPVLLDADALTILARSENLRQKVRQRPFATVLTPHAGELARLLDVERDLIEARPYHFVKQAAVAFNCCVLLKGSITLVAEPTGAVRANPTGTAWLGTAGSGDVLSGLAGTYLSAGCSALDAGSVAAFVHGVAGQVLSHGEVSPLRSRELADALPQAVAALRESSV